MARKKSDVGRPVRVRGVGVGNHVATDANRTRGGVLVAVGEEVADGEAFSERFGRGGKRDVGRARVLQEEPVFVERGEVCQRRIEREIPERYYWFVENSGDWTLHGERGGIDRVWDTRSCD